jgi:hypothetical protein
MAAPIPAPPVRPQLDALSLDLCCLVAIEAHHRMHRTAPSRGELENFLDASPTELGHSLGLLRRAGLVRLDSLHLTALGRAEVYPKQKREDRHVA